MLTLNKLYILAYNVCMDIILAVLGVFAILVLSEVLWRLKIIRGELARKFIHISVGSFVAFWPYFMTWQEVQLMSLAFLLVVIVSWKFTIFHAIHKVKRKTWGEVWFPIGIGIASIVSPSKEIFAAAILHVALADGFAAVIGTAYGKAHHYRFFSYRKTVIGSLTFWFISTCIVIGTLVAVGSVSPLIAGLLIFWLPIATTFVESFAILGTDNVIIPIIVIAAMQLIAIA